MAAFRVSPTCHTCASDAAGSSGAASSINGWQRSSVLKVVCFLHCQKSGPSERRRTIKCEDGIKKVVCRREKDRRVGPGLGCGATIGGRMAEDLSFGKAGDASEFAGQNQVTVRLPSGMA